MVDRRLDETERGIACQNASSRRPASGAPPVMKPYQPSSALMAPPDVPLIALSAVRSAPSSSARLSNCSSRMGRTPPVYAAWLPPPWQAIAMRLVAIRPPGTRVVISLPHR